MKNTQFQVRKLAVMQMIKGKTLAETAELVGYSTTWVHKWYKRYRKQGWQGLHDKSRAPKNISHKKSVATKLAIQEARLELEARQGLKEGLKYIGGRAIRTYLKEKNFPSPPSVPTIERVLREMKMTRHKSQPKKEKIEYPHLHPTCPHQQVQVDIVPHFLTGGQRVACFNAIDVVSRYMTGRAFLSRQAKDAVTFLTHVWQEIGLPRYTQVDNEGCFSGGATHPYVLGQVVRAALHVGTELLFSPCYNPESNGYVERSHQDYNRHVWQGTYLADLEVLEKEAAHFFQLYGTYASHKKLAGQTPYAVHAQWAGRKLTPQHALEIQNSKLPLRSGRIHFMRRVEAGGTVRVLNVNWDVPQWDDLLRGVWVTLELQPEQAILSIFDGAPDAIDRKHLAAYPFPLKEPVLSWEPLPTGEDSSADQAVPPLCTIAEIGTGDLPNLDQAVSSHVDRVSQVSPQPLHRFYAHPIFTML